MGEGVERGKLGEGLKGAGIGRNGTGARREEGRWGVAKAGGEQCEMSSSGFGGWHWAYPEKQPDSFEWAWGKQANGAVVELGCRIHGQ